MDSGILAPWHWAILIGLILLVFGPSKLPELGSSLGKSIRGFKDGLKDVEDGVRESMAEGPAERQPVLAAVAQPMDTLASEPAAEAARDPGGAAGI